MAKAFSPGTLVALLHNFWCLRSYHCELIRDAWLCSMFVAHKTCIIIVALRNAQSCLCMLIWLLQVHEICFYIPCFWLLQVSNRIRCIAYWRYAGSSSSKRAFGCIVWWANVCTSVGEIFYETTSRGYFGEQARCTSESGYTQRFDMYKKASVGPLLWYY